MPVPSSADIYVQKLLTDMSVGFAQEDKRFVADKAALSIPVTQQGGKYGVIPRGEFNRIQVKARASGAEAAEGRYKIDVTPTYFADPSALRCVVSDDEQDNADGDMVFDLEEEAVEFLRTQAQIYRENSFCAAYMANGIWTGNYDGVTSGENNTSTFRRFDDPASDPIGVVTKLLTIQTELGVPRPNVGVLQAKVWDAIKLHPDIVGRVDRGQTQGAAIVTKQNVAALFELDEILVTQGVQNTAMEGATDAHSFICGKHALFFYRPPRAGKRTPSAMYTFNWLGTRRQNARAFGWSIDKWYDKAVRGFRMEMNQAFVHKVTSADCGVFLEDIVS